MYTIHDSSLDRIVKGALRLPLWQSVLLIVLSAAVPLLILVTLPLALVGVFWALGLIALSAFEGRR